MRIIDTSMFVARSCLALVLTLISTLGAIAQSANTGALEGRVFDEARGEYLQNARVTVEGTQLETFTDDGGYYVLGNVPAGASKLRVFFTGLPAVTVPVTVTAGQATTKDVSLTSKPDQPAPGEPVRLSEFVVSTSKE